jgi:hypothetical protein
VCTSTTRPASPFEGQAIYETDTDKVLVYNGSAWYPNWNLPWGVVNVTSVTSAVGSITSETVRITSPSFTAVTNRLYRISYYEPVLEYISGTQNVATMRIRLTNISGAIQQLNEVKMQSFNKNSGLCTIVKTLTAGSTVLVGTIVPSGGTMTCYSDANIICQLIVEDIGPA